MGSEEERKNFLTQVRKACAIGKKLRDLGIRKYGVIRIDSAASPSEWAKDPAGSTKKIADTFRQACDVAEQYGERLAAEGEIWGRYAERKAQRRALEMVNRRRRSDSGDMRTRCFQMVDNGRDRRLPEDFDWWIRRRSTKVYIR